MVFLERTFQVANISLHVGDQVKAYDPATKQVSTQTVQQVFINHDTDLINVTLAVQTPTKDAAPTKQQKVAVASHGSHAPPSATTTTTEVVYTTQKHPWLTTKGWITAGELHLGDQVQQLDGTTVTVVALTIIPGAQDMYDLTVSNVHTFAVGNMQTVVHNITCTPQPYGGAGGGHHIHAKAAWKIGGSYLGSYSENQALAIRNGAFRRFGWNHQAMSTMQRQLFDRMAAGDPLFPNTWTGHNRIAYLALRAGGVPGRLAYRFVRMSFQDLIRRGVAPPIHIPWH